MTTECEYFPRRAFCLDVDTNIAHNFLFTPRCKVCLVSKNYLSGAFFVSSWLRVILSQNATRCQWWCFIVDARITTYVLCSSLIMNVDNALVRHNTFLTSPLFSVCMSCEIVLDFLLLFVWHLHATNFASLQGIFSTYCRFACTAYSTGFIQNTLCGADCHATLDLEKIPKILC